MTRKIFVLAAACVVALGGCNSQEQQQEAAQRKADKEAYRVDTYGSGQSIYTPRQEKSK